MHNRLPICAVLALLIWPSPALSYAQGSETGSQPGEPATKLEKFLARRNVLVVKETRFIGAVPGAQGAEVRIEALALSAPAERARAFGVRLARPAPHKEAIEQSGMIDFDELSSLQEALDHMLKTASEARPPDESPQPASGVSSVIEFSIITRGGIKIGLAQTGRQFSGQLHLGPSAETGEITFGIGALGRLRNLIAQAREKLAEAGAK